MLLKGNCLYADWGALDITYYRLLSWLDNSTGRRSKVPRILDSCRCWRVIKKSRQSSLLVSPIYFSSAKLFKQRPSQNKWPFSSNGKITWALSYITVRSMILMSISLLCTAPICPLQDPFPSLVPNLPYDSTSVKLKFSSFCTATSKWYNIPSKRLCNECRNVLSGSVRNLWNFAGIMIF